MYLNSGNWHPWGHADIWSKVNTAQKYPLGDYTRCLVREQEQGAVCNKSNRDLQLQLWLDLFCIPITAFALAETLRPLTKHLWPIQNGNITAATCGWDAAAGELCEYSKTLDQNLLPPTSNLPVCLFSKSNPVLALKDKFKEELCMFQSCF